MDTALCDVSIILVSWNTRDLLLACLEALPEAVGGLRSDVWVVDNASSDNSVEVVQARFPDVRVIANTHNLGFAAANNQAIRLSSGRYVLLLNSDTVPPPGSIERLVRFADARPRAGIVGPLLLYPDGSFQGSFADLPSFRSELLSVMGLGTRIYGPWYPNHGPRASQKARRAGYIQGACMLTRRSAVARVGMMDEQYFMYSEEVDWCLRMQAAGWEVWFTPDAQIVHHGGQSTQRVRPAMVRALYRSKVRFFRKHYGASAATLLRSIFLVVLRCKWVLRILVALAMSGESVGPPISWEDLASRALIEEQAPSLAGSFEEELRRPGV